MGKRVKKVIVVFEDGSVIDYPANFEVKTEEKPRKIYTDKGIIYIYPDGGIEYHEITIDDADKFFTTSRHP